VSAWCGVATST